MKGQVRLKKIIQVAAVLKSGLWIASWSFWFFLADKGGFKLWQFIGCLEILKFPYGWGKPDTRKGGLPMGDFFIIEKA